jgi:hypothetical protein
VNTTLFVIVINVDRKFVVAPNIVTGPFENNLKSIVQAPRATNTSYCMLASLSRLLKTAVVSGAIFKLFVSECVRTNEIPFRD